MRHWVWLGLLWVFPALACRLEWQYPETAWEPDRFEVQLNKANNPVAQVSGSARSLACEDWYSGHVEGRVRVVALLGEPGAALHQSQKSRWYEYLIDVERGGVRLIGKPFGVILVQP